MRTVLGLILGAGLLIGAGPISKFDDHGLSADYVSRAKLEDVERCLMDMKGWLIPNVYRQPDRPDDVMLIWIGGGLAGGIAAARVDLRREIAGTHIRSWMPAKQVEACAPK
ncbi:hypothetical protein PQ455_01425 [Sphingomonas naphthae]|uniref:Uncharacterized protein n=1 Tax=Sphingomonas naphthae TaxID=1813468 RepID=A0ABY7TL10_9SPHN|nr:hypothetical protein [Sphingomonas naphthae]WCT73921.1 hypothetical protein PQ455_01425 [Sphingomonas naphthae]